MAVTLKDTLVVSGMPDIYEYFLTGDAAAQDIRAARTGYRHIVLGYMQSEATAATPSFQSIDATPTTNKDYTLELTTNNSLHFPLGSGVLFLTNSGEKLTINLPAAVSEAWIWLVEVPATEIKSRILGF